MSWDAAEAASILAAAARQATPVEALTHAHPGLAVGDAYEVQDLVVEDRLREGGTLIGAKLGLTSTAKQVQMSVHEPIYGRLTSDMVLDGFEPLPSDRFIHPRAEPEIGFILGSELEGPTTAQGVLAATDAVFAAVEIIDSRFEGFRFQLADVIADNASSAGLILGGVRRRPDDLEDLGLLGCVMHVDGVIQATAAGAAVLGHPAQAVAWLVNRLHERQQAMPAGSVILSGAMTDAVPLGRDTVVSVEIHGLGRVGIRTE